MIVRKTVDIIIDNGNSDNLIKKEVLALKLKCYPHKKPYQMSWIHQAKGIKISQLCTVQLSIGQKYSDEIICDVVDMDVSHLIFSRLWQFDTDISIKVEQANTS